MDVPPLIQEGTIEKENILDVTDCIENLKEVGWYFLKTGKSDKSNKNFMTSLTTFTMGRHVPEGSGQIPFN